MYQTFFIIINNQSINILNNNPVLYIQQISSLCKFKIKKLFPSINGALIIIDFYNVHLIKNNNNIIIVDENEINIDSNVLKIFNINSYKLLMKFKHN